MAAKTLLTARPTTYNGIKMRSRLEARFAATMDLGGRLTWLYEPRAYASTKGQYLPDFQVTELDGATVDPPWFIEVKPTVEQAFMAMERMVIIWDSEPDATLCIAVPGHLRFFAAGAVDRTWRLP